MNLMTCRGEHTPAHTPPLRAACLTCWHWHHTASVRERMGGDPAGAVPYRKPDIITTAESASARQAAARLKTPCRFRGERLAVKPRCGQPAMYPCGKFGDVTVAVGRCVDAQRSCGDCTVYEVPPSATAPSTALAATGTDKHTKHGYGPMYDAVLKGREVRSLLEIGTLRGAGVRAFRMMFPAAEIIAADSVEYTAERVKDVPNCRFVRLDVNNPADLDAFAVAHPAAFDVVVDDSTHVAANQRDIRERLWACVRPGGVLVIEDVGDDGLCAEFEKLGGAVYDNRAATGHDDSRAVVFEKGADDGAGKTDAARGASGAALRPDSGPDANPVGADVPHGHGAGRERGGGGAPQSRIETRKRTERGAGGAVRLPRVLFASHDLSLSGAPIILANLTPHLRGIEPVLYAPADGPLQPRFDAAGVPVTHSPDLAGVELLVANTVAPPIPKLIAEARAAGVPVVWLIHESDPTLFDLAAIRDVIGYPVRVVFPCRETADAYAGMRTAGVEIIPSIIPPVPRRSRLDHRRPFVIVTTGRDEPRKGQADIRAAIEGADGVRLITLPGDEPDPHRLYASADLYVCSSRVEAYPLAIQEAKAHGLPVITTPVYGCSEIIRDGVDGLHYQPGDVVDLRTKIDRLRDEAELRAKLSRPLTHLPSFGESVAMYEGVIHAALGTRPPTAQPVRVVYHTAGGWGPWWRDVVSEQFAQLAAAGLRVILGTHVGDDPAWVMDEAARHGLDYTLTFHSPRVEEWEGPAIRLVERLVRHDDTPVLYIHAKGVSHDPRREPVYHDWRRLMMAELVGKWRENLAHLRTHDAVGVNWWPRYPHFSGNFWLATAAWLRRLPDYDEVYRDRYTCERWIGLTPGCRAKSLVCRDRKFWVPGKDQEAMYAALNSQAPADSRTMPTSGN